MTLLDDIRDKACGEYSAFAAEHPDSQPVGDFVNNQFAALAISHCGTRPDTREKGVEAARWFMQKVVEILIGLREGEEKGYEYLKGFIDLAHQPKDATFDDLDEHPLIVTGDPERCIRKLERIQGYGADQVICFHQFGGLEHDRIMESIRLFGEQIIPHFNKASAGA